MGKRGKPGSWWSMVELILIELEEGREAVRLAVLDVLQALALQCSCSGCALEDHQGGCAWECAGISFLFHLP